MNNKGQYKPDAENEHGVMVQTVGDADLSREFVNIDLCTKMIYANDPLTIRDGLQYANLCWLQAPPVLKARLPLNAPTVEVMKLYSNMRYPSPWSYAALGLGSDDYIYRLVGDERQQFEYLRYLAIVRKYWSEWVINFRKLANEYGMLYFEAETGTGEEVFDEPDAATKEWNPDDI